MKKIGILTFHYPINYGAVLQAFALYCFIKSQPGVQKVEIVDFFTDEMWKKCSSFYPATIKTSGLKGLLYRIITFFLILTNLKALEAKKKKFINFRTAKMNHSAKYSTAQALKKAQLDYNAVVFGSDQVFNPKRSNYGTFFGDFTANTTIKKIAYAPSFGIHELDGYRAALKPYLEDFQALSCREQSGAEFIAQTLGRECPVVLDPVFLMDPQDWTEIEKPYALNEKSYVLCYALNSPHLVIEQAKKAASNLNLPLVVVTPTPMLKLKNSQCLFDVGLEEFLWLIHQAKYVVTDSFHGTALSIVYRKNFAAVNTLPTASGRLKSLLDLLQIPQQLISVTDCWKEELLNIDYEKVEPIITEKRQSSIAYLQNALEQI